jgi:copper chaperone CopZ
MIKKILIILLALPLGMVAQDKQKKNVKAEFTVKGNCEICEKRIEKAALSIKGVKLAEWDVNSNQISLIYNPKKASLEAIHAIIAAQGHDTLEAQAKKEDYDKLPKCCQYDREEP